MKTQLLILCILFVSLVQTPAFAEDAVAVKKSAAKPAAASADAKVGASKEAEAIPARAGMNAVPTGAKDPAAAEAEQEAQRPPDGPLAPPEVPQPGAPSKWYIKANYDTLPCLTIQQTQALKAAREDGVENLVKEADIFFEKTKAFFQKNKKFICPPVLDSNPPAGKTVVMNYGTAAAFETIYIVYPWQMEVLTGTSKEEIWKMRFSTESGVGTGKTKKLKNDFTLVPLMPRDSDKYPYLIHSMKIPGHEKELIRICYPAEKRKACNPYGENQEEP